jgi:hypothetical protein
MTAVLHINIDMKPHHTELIEDIGGADGTRTRDLRRDRPLALSFAERARIIVADICT